MSNCGSRPKKMENGGPAAPIMPEEAKEIRKKKRKERNASREQTRMPSKKMREAMAKGYEYGGTVSDADLDSVRAILSPGTFKTYRGNSLSDRDIEMVREMFRNKGEDGRSISDRDIQAVRRAFGNKVKRYENGGCVMKGRGGKFKGIS